MSELKTSLQDRTLIFLHIQKCAGNSLIDLLQAFVPPRQVLKGHLLHPDSPAIPRPVDSYRLIIGHNTYYDMSRMPVDPVYMTMLRDPIDRIVSLYYFWRSHRDDYIQQHDLKGPRLAKQLSLEEFIECEEPEALLSIRNAQCGQFHNGLRGSPGLSDEELFETSRERLDACAFVGITSEFERSVDLLCYVFGWKRPASLRSVNESFANEQEDPRYEPTERPPLPDHVRQRLIDLNQADLKLYAHARDAFHRNLQIMEEERRSGRIPDQRTSPLLSYRIRRTLSDRLKA
jgi:hypothetical protein